MLLTRMPDLTTIHLQVCESVDREHEFHISGTHPYTQVVCYGNEERDRCTCPGYKYHGRCKHIAEARTKLCDWNAQYSEERQTPQQELDMICPKCGSDTRMIAVGV